MYKSANYHQLATYRNEGDEPADRVVEELARQEGITYLRQLMPHLANFTVYNFAELHPLFAKFYEQNAHFPNNYNKKLVVRSTDFYMRYQQQIGMLLGCYSLPYCYLAEDGARVLCMSQRIGKDTYQRLKETGNFVRRVMNNDYWQSEHIFSIIFKVRFMHAFVRYFTLNSGKWQNEWGHPINQEDMAGTNLAFSLIVLRGLRKMGLSVDESAEEAYLMHWYYIGQLLGVKPDLLVTSIKEAITLDKAIAERQFRASQSGQELTKALMNCYAEMTGSQLATQFFQAQAHLLLGEQYAQMLAIPTPNIPLSVLQAFNVSTSFLSNMYA